MYLPFNEITIHNDFFQNEDGLQDNDIIIMFIDFVKESIEKNCIDGFLVDSSVVIIESSIIKRWLNNSLISREHKSLLRTILGKYFQTVETPLMDCSIEIDSKIYFSKGAAISIDRTCDFILNLRTNYSWCLERQNYICQKFDDNNNFTSYEKELIQLSTIEDLPLLLDYNKCVSYKQISSGQDLWEKWEILFPNLIKCFNVKHCLYENPEKNHIDKIIEQLDYLQQYFSNNNEIFSFEKLKLLGLDVSDESISVKNDPNLKKYRLFRLPNGDDKYFFYHLKFYGKFETRIYFLPTEKNSKCYIGYIGKHLKTKKF